MFFRGRSGKVTVHAYDVTTGLPKTGDAANITCRISKDGGASAALGDTNPTELDATNHPGDYVFDLTATELTANMVNLRPSSITANIKFEPASIVVYTERTLVRRIHALVGGCKMLWVWATTINRKTHRNEEDTADLVAFDAADDGATTLTVTPTSNAP